MNDVTLVDGSRLTVDIVGDGPTLLLPVNPKPIEGPQAEQIRQYGADPALGQNLINGLSDIVRVVAFDYEGHLWQSPRADTLTPDNVVDDLLTIADAVGADQFAYYGYSWLAMIGLQLAMRTDRLAALVMGGFPPIDGPYAALMRVTTAAYEQSGADQAVVDTDDDEWSTARLSKDQTKQYKTLYQTLQTFNDRAVQSQITCPRLCFVGSADEITYDKKWGDVLVSLAGPVVQGQAELEALGWDVRVLDGLDHMQAMQANAVVPLLRDWLPAALA
ncbi:MAG: alpha/beta hydrolase [Anaerolineaceae bacterium]|nr:alpha/beta hydrolase [Anaerolineaceae bacterium]